MRATRAFGDNAVYEDNDLWPFKCPECGEEFTKEIGWLKAQGPKIRVKCPGIVNLLGPIPCPITIECSDKEFGLMLTEAEAGGHNVFGTTWVRKRRP